MQQVDSVKHKVKEQAEKQKSEDDKCVCKRCGTRHGRKSCPAFDKECIKCKKKGHFARCCRTKQTVSNLNEDLAN